MAIQLKYNNVEILENQPTPIVSKSESMVRYGERWAELSSVTLRGQVTGCPNNFSGLLYEQRQLIDIFSKDFQTFEIYQDGNLIHSKPFCLVKDGVRFPSSTYNGSFEYEVALECYEENLFSGVFGVLDPEDSWSFQETDDQTLTATHTVSARGFNTSSGASNALQNAVSFVASRTGNDLDAQPYFISLPTGFGICLRTVKESPNRFNGTYSVTLTYEGDLYYNQGGVLRYTTSSECNTVEGLTAVAVQGELRGCPNASISDLRSRYASFDVYDAASEAYADLTTSGSLNTGYLASGVVEEPYSPALRFNISFDNFTGAQTYFDYKVDLVSGENDVVTVSVDGTIVSRGDIRTRWQNVSGFYSSLNLFPYAQAAYAEFSPSGPSLNTSPNSSGVTLNQFAGEIRTSATWDNKKSPVSGFANLDYSFEFLPSLEKVVAKPLATNTIGSICGDTYGYYVLDAGYKNRCVFAMQGNGRIDCETDIHTALDNLKVFANSGFSTYCPNTRALLEVNQITTGLNTISFNFSWSAESSNNVVAPRSDYQNINTLALK